MFEPNSEDESNNDSELDLTVETLSVMEVKLLKLKYAYQELKLFSQEPNEETAAKLATLRFKIRMIESGIQTND